MLLDTIDRNVSSSGVLETARATIKTSPKIFNFFADQTYANKPRAIARELVANAFDSHVMAGKPDLPVEVWLPTLLEPVFRVRDFGLGMSHSFMMNEFMCYADGSTKDQSNIAIGGFGIGSKSPFAYVDQYTVTSKFEGTESVYTVFKDEDGIPSIALLGQRPTDDGNGVEVAFPVKPEDFGTFEEAAFKALRFFEPLPDIKNANEGAFEAPEYVARGKTWGMREHSGPLQIIMGGVMYPVDVNNLSYKFDYDSPAQKLLQYGLDLRVPIGTCSVALSREALSYDDRTIIALQTTCESVIDEVAESFANMFDQYETLWEAATALYKEVNGAGRHDRGKFLAEHAKWRGEPLSTALDHPLLGEREITWGEDKGKKMPVVGYDTWVISSRSARSSRRAKSGYSEIGSARWETPDPKYGFEPGHYAYLVIDDLPPLPKHKAIRKIKEFAEDLGDREAVLVVRPDVDQDISVEAIIEGFGSPPNVALTSEMPEPIVERTAAGRMANRPKVRMFRYDGSYQRRNNWRQPDTRVSPEREGVYEIAAESQPEEGIYVEMENFIPKEGFAAPMSSGLLNYRELVFVNRADVKKLPKDKWVSHLAEFERRKKEKLAQYPELAQRLAVANAHELRPTFDFFRRNPDVDFTSRKPLGQIFKLYRQYVEPLDQDQHQLARFVTTKLPRGVKPAELLEKFKTKQRNAWRLMGLLSHHSALDEADLALFQENL